MGSRSKGSGRKVIIKEKDGTIKVVKKRDLRERFTFTKILDDLLREKADMSPEARRKARNKRKTQTVAPSPARASSQRKVRARTAKRIAARKAAK